MSELDEHLRLGIGGRPGVDEHRRCRLGGEHDGKRRPQHTGRGPQPQPRRRHDRAGGAAETSAAAWPRLMSWHATATLDRGRRQLASAPSSMPSTSSAGTIGMSRSAPCSASKGRSAGRLPGQHDANLVLTDGDDRAGDDLFWSVVAAHGVNRDGWPRQGVTGPVAEAGRRTTKEQSLIAAEPFSGPDDPLIIGLRPGGQSAGGGVIVTSANIVLL